MCKTCKEIRPYSSTEGTTTIKLHSCNFRITATALKSDITLTPLEQKTLLSNQVNHLAYGLLPFKQAENPGLITLLNNAVDLGAKYGRFNIETVLNDRKLLSKATYNKAEQTKRDFENEIKNLDQKSFCLITDGWSDSVNKNCYVDYSIQLIDYNFNLKNIQIDMVHFAEAKTSINIMNSVVKKCETLGVGKESITVITDSAPNMVKACKGMQHYRCLCHRLNTAIEKAFNETCSDDEYLALIDQGVTSLIGFVNKTGLQHEMPIKLKSGSVTRPWRRYSDKFGSLHDSHDKLVEILNKVFYILLD